MSNQIEQICAEIERRISDNTFGAKLELIDLLAWLDQLPTKENPILAPADVQEAEIRKISITPSEVRYVIDAIHSYAGIFRAEDDAKKGLAIFKAGEQHERERLMKEAVECEIGWSDGYRIAPADEKSMNEALAKIGVLDQVGAGVDAKVSVIIIKKEDEK